MADISTTYLGIKLTSPIILSSSGLSNNIEQIREAAQYGAGAIVLKSLFEEQIKFDINKALSDTTSSYPEAEDYIKNYSRHKSVKDYIQLIKKTKDELNIPIIASVNCISNDEWTNFAKDIENAGADALELNIYILPNNIYSQPGEIEEKYFEIVETIRKEIKIPIVIKIGSSISNLPWFVNQLKIRGANAVVLFNRFYIPDINIDKQQLVSGNVFSNESDIRESLRWTGLISGIVPGIEVSTSTGIHDGSAVIKQLLAGAQTVQVCSVLYKKGLQTLEKMTEELINWMDKNNYRSIDEFRGRLSYANINNPLAYERSQFIKHITSLE